MSPKKHWVKKTLPLLAGMMVISGGVSLSVRETFGETFFSATFSGQSPVLGSPTPEGPPLVHIPRRDILSQRPQGKPSEGGIKVLGARTPQEASQIAQELQTTWEQTARLADRWTQTHRRPDFARSEEHTSELQSH